MTTNSPTASAPRPLWVRWAALVAFVMVIGALFIRLGEWQIHRLEWRRANNARVVAYQKQPVKPYQEVFGPTITDEVQWQRVQVSGSYDGGRQFQAMLRNQSDRAGSEVVTPLRTTRGEWLLVDRGFLPRGEGASEVAVLPPPPTGQVTVTGYVRRNERGKPQAITPDRNIVRLINSDAIGATLPYPVMNGFLALAQSTPTQGGELEPIATPKLTEGNHLSYAIQWFCFTGIAVAGAVILIRADLRDRRKLRARQQRLAARRALAGKPLVADDRDQAPATSGAFAAPHSQPQEDSHGSWT